VRVFCLWSEPARLLTVGGCALLPFQPDCNPQPTAHTIVCTHSVLPLHQDRPATPCLRRFDAGCQGNGAMANASYSVVNPIQPALQSMCKLPVE
jgi:hypothetical protein